MKTQEDKGGRKMIVRGTIGFVMYVKDWDDGWDRIKKINQQIDSTGLIEKICEVGFK